MDKVFSQRVRAKRPELQSPAKTRNEFTQEERCIFMKQLIGQSQRLGARNVLRASGKSDDVARFANAPMVIRARANVWERFSVSEPIGVISREIFVDALMK